MYKNNENIEPILIHLNILWEKNKNIPWPDWHTTPYMYDNKEHYAPYLDLHFDDETIQNQYNEHLETIEYWTEFYKKATIDDMLSNKNSYIMIENDMSVYDGYHRLTAAKLAKKDIIVATFDFGPWHQGKPNKPMQF